ncbi:uncharacterized protein BCR38DRAFT_490046 [Pseudomassariella vexata]|uniref:Uncharacterized protein n=1 Tax=Pseudomassariella vexata TaxID=1141098 RepID=A0A1Y2DE27_9PEZI|nr:uncharacterized protein BCR38DRAFT_490046 [Pseudomassariella vexata]ORY57543.1 hypothetical protein BCR38DRAFT_490046 [Pseudomassariella vexata]
MDHFNATVCNGAMISTRRGFQVTKQKHKGTAFVNSSVQDHASKKPRARAGFSLPVATTLTFINNEEDEKKYTQPKRRSRGSKDAERASRLKPASMRKRRTSSESSGNHPIRESCQRFGLEENYEELGSLPAWASYKLPKNLRDSSKRLLFMTLAFVPDKASPFKEYGMLTYNPLKFSDRDIWLVQDPTILHSAIALGALFDAIRSGKKDSPGLTSLTSQLCSIINRRLNQKEQSGLAREITMHAVAALAIIAGYQGKHDHWYVHMKGLVHLIDLVGGQEKLDVRTLGAIRKADLAGAVSAATRPCVSCVKPRLDLRSVLPEAHQERNSRAVQRLLNACHIDTEIVETIASVAGFNDCLDYCKKKEGTKSKFEPDALMEYFFFLKYQLLSKPEALRDFDEVITPKMSRKFPLSAQDFPTPVSMDLSVDAYSKAIESAMRILTILYLREPTLDLPCGETVLLDLLTRHMTIILTSRRGPQPENSMIDPSLLEDSTPTQSATLIWMCIAGDCFSTSKMATSVDHSDKMGQPSIYKQLLIEVLGPHASANPELVSQEDLELCRFLDLRYVRGTQWSERSAMRHILGVIKVE